MTDLAVFAMYFIPIRLISDNSQITVPLFYSVIKTFPRDFVDFI